MVEWEEYCHSCPAASGKDSLLARLRGRDVPNAYISTHEVAPVPGYQIDFPDGEGGTICFNVKAGMNVGGEEAYVEDYWGDACKDVDVIFYLVDTPQLLSELTDLDLTTIDAKSLRKHSPCLKRLTSDMRFLTAEALGRKTEARLAIALNKIDLPLSADTDHTLTEKLEAYTTELDKLRTVVETVAKSGLGNYHNRLRTIEPLSCKDSEMFAQLFPVILKKVAEV